jgi:hypothetical protein
MRAQVIFLVLALGGCATVDPVVRASEGSVGPFNGGQPVVLGAQDVVDVLGLAGLDRDDILECGVEFRRSLATNGGASIRKNGQVVALFAVFDDEIYVSSVQRGNFRVAIPPSTYRNAGG